jgi:hypothetical protein
MLPPHIITALQKWALVTKEKWHPPLTKTPRSPNTGVNTQEIGLRGKLQRLFFQVHWFLYMSHLPTTPPGMFFKCSARMSPLLGIFKLGIKMFLSRALLLEAA